MKRDDSPKAAAIAAQIRDMPRGPERAAAKEILKSIRACDQMLAAGKRRARH